MAEAAASKAPAPATEEELGQEGLEEDEEYYEGEEEVDGDGDVHAQIEELAKKQAALKEEQAKLDVAMSQMKSQAGVTDESGGAAAGAAVLPQAVDENSM